MQVAAVSVLRPAAGLEEERLKKHLLDKNIYG